MILTVYYSLYIYIYIFFFLNIYLKAPEVILFIFTSNFFFFFAEIPNYKIQNTMLTTRVYSLFVDIRVGKIGGNWTLMR